MKKTQILTAMLKIAVFSPSVLFVLAALIRIATFFVSKNVTYLVIALGDFAMAVLFACFVFCAIVR